MDTIGRLFGPREMSEKKEKSKVTNRDSRRALARFGVIGGAVSKTPIKGRTSPLLSFLTTVFALSLILAGIADADLTTDLAAFYPFNGNANDESGNGNDGLVVGATLTADRFGAPDSAFSFAGQTGGIQVPDNGSSLDITGDFSIALWLRRTGTLTGWFLHKHISNLNDDGSWWLACDGGDGHLTFQATPHFDNLGPTSSPIPIGVWTFVVFTYNRATGDWKFHINGTPDTSGTVALTIGDTSIPLLIGIRDDNLFSFPGDLDDIRIYKRRLADAEVLDLFVLPAVCGNGIVESGEQCDDGNTSNGDCCSSSCQFETMGSACPGDGNICTSDVCNASGVCTHPPGNNGTTCPDGNACTTNDVCTNGTCGGTAVTCTALDQCHDVGTCDPQTGQCSNPNKPNGTACSDGSACTTSDTCQAGVCTGSNPVTCSASDQCHDAGTCDPATGVCSSPPKANGTACSDGNACTTADHCSAGTCVGSAVVCNDNNACTTDSCDPATGCTTTPVVCNDNNACTTDSCDPATGCTTTPVVCNDNNACTTDSCDPATGCTTSPISCNDGNACTDDSCNPATGCVFTNNTASCNDGNPSTVNDICTSGVCVGTPANHPPVCTSATALPSTLWPPNHQLLPISISGVTDPDGDSVTITATSVFQDESVSATTGDGSGSTTPDAILSPLQVRAERNGTGDGRVYHLNFTANDGKGGTCTGAITVCVPHDQGKGKICVDGGSLSNSLGP